MTIQIEEKFSMITIPNATAMREKAEARREVLDKAWAIEKQEREIREMRRKELRKMELMEKVPDVLTGLMEEIAKSTNNGHTYVSSKLWMEDTVRWGLTWQDVDEIHPIIAEILGQAGYEVSEPSWYSKCWRSKSHKVLTWGYISWGKA